MSQESTTRRGGITGWIEAEIITADQATQIRAYEAELREERRPRNRGPLVEILGYLGSALIIVSALIVVGEVWEDTAQWGRVATALFGGTGLLLAGFLMVRTKTEALTRLGSALWMLAVIPIGLAAGLIVEPTASDEVTALVGFGAALALSAVLYGVHRHLLQHIALFVAVIGTVESLLAVVTSGSPPDLAPAVVLAAIGAGWVVAARTGAVVPRFAGELLGLIAAFQGLVIGASALQENPEPILLVGIALGAGMVWLGVRESSVLYIVFGTLAMVVFIPWFVVQALDPNLGAPLALLLVGLGLVAGAVLASRSRKGPEA